MYVTQRRTGPYEGKFEKSYIDFLVKKDPVQFFWIRIPDKPNYGFKILIPKLQHSLRCLKNILTCREVPRLSDIINFDSTIYRIQNVPKKMTGLSACTIH